MNYIIWGAGIRGKRVYEFLGIDAIIAFIDTNQEKIGESFGEKPVISFEIYLEKYSEYPILISIENTEKIEQQLDAAGVQYYFRLQDCPLEMRTIKVQGEFLKKFPTEIKQGEKCLIYGVTAYSIYLLEKLINGGAHVSIIPQTECSAFVRHKVEEAYGVPFLDRIPPETDKVFLTIPEVERKLLEGSKSTEMIEAYDFLHALTGHFNTELKKYYKRHLGQRCFIVATGPSLQVEDLDKLYLNHEICISMNFIYKAFDKTAWRPNYLVVEDNLILDQNAQEIIDAPVKEKFISDGSDKFWSIQKSQKINKVHLGQAVDAKRYPKFSENIVQGVYNGRTVVYNCIQIAVYMGFHEIYLLGVDFNYSGASNQDGNHFYRESDSSLKQKTNPVALEDSYRAFQKAKEFAQSHNISIYNATRGGKLEVFERVDFDSLFT